MLDHAATIKQLVQAELRELTGDDALVVTRVAYECTHSKPVSQAPGAIRYVPIS